MTSPASTGRRPGAPVTERIVPPGIIRRLEASRSKSDRNVHRTLRVIVGVDRHVLLRQVARVDRRIGAAEAAGEVDPHFRGLERRGDLRASIGTGWPLRKTIVPCRVSVARSGSNSARTGRPPRRSGPSSGRCRASRASPAASWRSRDIARASASLFAPFTVITTTFVALLAVGGDLIGERAEDLVERAGRRRRGPGASRASRRTCPRRAGRPCRSCSCGRRP